MRETVMNVVVQAKDFDEHSLKALRLRDCEIAEEDMISAKATAMRPSPTSSRPGASRPTKFRGRSRRKSE